MKRCSRIFHPTNTITFSLVMAVFWLACLPGSLRAGNLPDIWQAAIQAHLEKKYVASIRYLNQYLAQTQEPAKTIPAQFFLAENYSLSGQTEQAFQLYQQLASAGNAPAPLRVSARYRMAEYYYNQEHYQAAADGLRGLLHDSQAGFLFPQVPLNLVKAELKLKHNSDAQQVLAELLENSPRALLDPEIKFLYAIMKEVQGKPLDALKVYAELGDNALAHLFSGAILERQGRFLPAIEEYNRSLELAQPPSHRELAEYFKLRAFYKSGDFIAAESLVKRYLAAGPQAICRPQAALLLLLIHLAQARFTDVLEEFPLYLKDLARLSPEDQALFNWVLGEAHLNLDHYPEAILNYNQALKTAESLREPVLLKLAFAQLAVQDDAAAFQNINDYLGRSKTPDPLANLIMLKAGLESNHESAAFQAAQTLVQSGDALSELGLYWLAAHCLDRQEPQKLAGQWALLEKSFQSRPVPMEYREVGAWSRLLVAEAFFKTNDYPTAQRYYQQALGIYPRGLIPAQCYLGLAWCSFRLEDYAAVQTWAEKLAAQNKAGEPMASEISLLQAHAAFNLKQYDRAISAYEQWLKNSPGHPLAAGIAFQIGWAHYLNKSYLDAVETWKNMAKAYPQAEETPLALAWIADIYFQAGENAQSRAGYEQLLLRYPESASRHAYALRIAQTYYNELNDEEAVHRFMALMQAAPDSPEAAEAQKGIEAASYRIADRLNTIPAFHEFILKYPNSKLAEDIQYRIGEAYFAKEKYAESLAEFLQFILGYTHSPRTPNAQYYIAVCQEQLGHFPEAVAQAEAFLKNYPKHELAAEMTFRLASDEFQQAKYAAAAEHFAGCADNYALKEYQPRAWYNAAVCYEKLQLPDFALANYEKLIKNFPADANAAISLSRMAVLYAQRQKAEDLSKTLGSLQAKNDQELFQKTCLALAAYYKEQHQLTEEEQMLKVIMAQGLPKTPEYAMALVELASIYEQGKAWAQAKAIYQRLSETAVESKWRQAAAKRIELLTRIIKGK